MIKYSFHSQLTIGEFKMPFDRNLSKDNRWVKLSESIPWDHLASYFMKTMSVETGCLGISPQTVIGAMIIKHKLKLSDVETVEKIKENPHLQFMLGLTDFQEKAVFDSSLFVTIRKRMSAELFDLFNQEIIKCVEGKKDNGHNKNNKDEGGNPTDHDLLNGKMIL